jgi:bifunctional non-homologous end joining protein LigD
MPNRLSARSAAPCIRTTRSRSAVAPSFRAVALASSASTCSSAAAKLRARSFTLDGEAVVCDPDGVAVFNALHRRGTVTEAMFYAFDLLELDGEDLRAVPMVDRKKRLARLLSGRRLGIVLSDHTDDDGATIFRHACRIGLKGIVSKRLTAPYRSGRSTDWIKVKNPDSPAMIRARDSEW